MSDVTGTSKRYRYRLYPKIAGYVLAPLFTAFFTGLAIFLFEQGAIGVAVLCLLFAIGIALLIVLTSLTYALIGISDDGITAYKLGWKMKSIRWQDVKKIQKMRFWNMGARAYQGRFYVYDGDFGTRRKLMVNLRGPIVFTDEIRELRELLNRSMAMPGGTASRLSSWIRRRPASWLYRRELVIWDGWHLRRTKCA